VYGGKPGITDHARPDHAVAVPPGAASSLLSPAWARSIPTRTRPYGGCEQRSGSSKVLEIIDHQPAQDPPGAEQPPDDQGDEPEPTDSG
jgi:hypothetical protein